MQSARSTSPMASHQRLIIKNERTSLLPFAGRTVQLYEGVANHFSVAVNEDGTHSLMNPSIAFLAHQSLRPDSGRCQRSRDDESADAPDPTAWGLHGAPHRQCSQPAWPPCALDSRDQHFHAARSAATPIDQNCAIPLIATPWIPNMAGSFEEEAERCQQLSTRLQRCSSCAITG